MGIVSILGTILGPVKAIITKRQDRKAAREGAKAKLQQAKQAGSQQLQLNDQELERVLASAKKDSWLDEYVTVSLVSIVNAVVVGGVAASFGYTQVLEGTALAVRTLTEMGLELDFLLNAVVLSAVGLTVWRKL